jgi:hypothetical protein
MVTASAFPTLDQHPSRSLQNYHRRLVPYKGALKLQNPG